MTIHQDALDIEVNIVRVNSLLLIPIKRVITYLLFQIFTEIKSTFYRI